MKVSKRFISASVKNNPAYKHIMSRKKALDKTRILVSPLPLLRPPISAEREIEIRNSVQDQLSIMLMNSPIKWKRVGQQIKPVTDLQKRETVINEALLEWSKLCFTKDEYAFVEHIVTTKP